MHSIQYSFLDDIVWHKRGESIDGSRLSSQINIYRIAVSSNQHRIHQFEKLLSKDEQERALRFHQQKDEQRFIISRIVLRKLLADYLNISPNEIEFGEGLNKKPLLNNADFSDLHFNISHAGDMILFAIADEEIGVDIELKNKDFSFLEILPQNFSDKEIDFIKKHDDFYLLWTRKEALLKATAKGIDDDLPHVPSLDGTYQFNKETRWVNQNWTIKSFEAEENYIASIAYGSENKMLQFLELTL